MPSLNPAKRAHLVEWLQAFATDFVQQPQGVAHLAKYAENRKQGQAYYARVKADATAGKDITDGVLEFVKHPLRKGFKAGFLSPMLNALHPEQFAIVNKKPLALLSWAYDEKFTPSVEGYARTTTFLHHLARELDPNSLPQSPDADRLAMCWTCSPIGW